MFDMIKKIFGITKENKTDVKPNILSETVYSDHDIVDYDGMGNQGRFPRKKTNRQ
jgi:hypothetical protein